MRNRTALLAALGADNFGSGLFLPLVLVYVIRDVGLPVKLSRRYCDVAGTTLSLRWRGSLPARPNVTA